VLGGAVAERAGYLALAAAHFGQAAMTTMPVVKAVSKLYYHSCIDFVGWPDEPAAPVLWAALTAGKARSDEAWLYQLLDNDAANPHNRTNTCFYELEGGWREAFGGLSAAGAEFLALCRLGGDAARGDDESLTRGVVDGADAALAEAGGAGAARLVAIMAAIDAGVPVEEYSEGRLRLLLGSMAM
jgi:hypothetical protein